MTRRQWATGLLGLMVAAGSTTLLPTTAATTAAAATTPEASKSASPMLGNGLGRLLAQSGRPTLRKRSGFTMDQESVTVRDTRGRVLLQVTPQSNVDRASFRKRAEKLGLAVNTEDAESGTLSGFAPLSAARDLAALPGVGTIAQAVKPRTRSGSVQSQGVALQRTDKVQAKGIDGRGITIAALSDSYDTAETTAEGDPLTIHEAQDTRSGDLPGPGNPRNSKRVVVLDDLPAGYGLDEGRAMLQIAHDVAPGAKLCFGTAYIDLFDFADKIRRLADKKGPCGADVIVDDIGYSDESFFGDSPVSDAIDEVTAKGVHYFSAAGNNGEQQSWDSGVRLLPAKTGLKGTNLDFSDVDPALYDGGLQDMDPGRGTDVAQDITLGPDGGQLNLQWDDPVDLDGATLGAPIYQADGALSDASPEATFSFTPTAAQVGTQVQIQADAVPSGATDLVLSVDAPDGTNLGTIDTFASPELLATTLSQAGAYTITVYGFTEDDNGPVTVDVRPVLAPSKVTTDFNALFFDTEGHYLGSAADLNQFTGRPFEIAPIAGEPKIQLVVARHGSGRVAATRLRTVLDGDAYFTEFADPLAPAIYGHPMAKGSTAVAAYDPFRPFLAEPFTSAGGNLPVSFDSAGNRYRRTQVRRVPQVAGADRVNTTFFAADDLRDADTIPNFGGTSAAAPDVAGIAALVLQKAGGPRSLSPARLREKLQRSTFAHDLSPAHSSGSSGGLSIAADGAQGVESHTVPGPMNDPRFFTMTYQGKVPLKSVTLYGETASPTASGTRYPPFSDGIVFDPRPFDGESPFRTDGFPFTVGAAWGGLQGSKVSASFSAPGGGQSSAGQYRHMTLSFKSGLQRGQGLKFGVDRDLAVSGFGGANEGNGADELGGATFLPQGVAFAPGLVFVGERVDGRKIRGVMVNRLGQGFSPVDGYGLVNAEKAVQGR